MLRVEQYERDNSAYGGHACKYHPREEVPDCLGAGEQKKFKVAVIPKFSDPVQLTPQLSILAKKKRDDTIKAKKDAEIEQKQ